MTEPRPVLRRGPSGPRATHAGAILRTGYDAPEPTDVIETTTTSGFLPRNAAGDPLEVAFPDFQLGNTLDVEYYLSGSFAVETPADFSVTPQVSVDGGATFYFLFPGNAQGHAEVSGQIDLCAQGAVKIVDPLPILLSGVPSTIPVTEPPIVRLFFETLGALTLEGPIGQGGIQLKASEIAEDYVFQGPNGVLATT